MAQNKSSAVMQQRQEALDSFDDFPTPPWATRALAEHVLFQELSAPEWQPRFQNGWEPCCNRGFMAKPMAEYFGAVRTGDLVDYGWPGQERVEDFLFASTQPTADMPIDWVWANPPFVMAEQFIAKAMQVARVGCAMLVRTSFLEGTERWRELFSKNPPAVVAQFAERVIMHRGVLRDPSKKYWDAEAINKKTKQKGAWKRPSTATSYAWLVWVHGKRQTRFVWIPPCRTSLERDGDYILPAGCESDTK